MPIYNLDPNNPEHLAIINSMAARHAAALSGMAPNTSRSITNAPNSPESIDAVNAALATANQYRSLFNIPADVQNFSVQYAPPPVTTITGANPGLNPYLPGYIAPATSTPTSTTTQEQKFGQVEAPSRTQAFELPSRPLERRIEQPAQDSTLQQILNFPTLRRRKTTASNVAGQITPGAYNANFWNAWRI